MPQKRQLSKKVSNVPMMPEDARSRFTEGEEMRRARESYKEYTLSEEQRLEVIAKYGPPSAPLGSYHSMILPPKKKKKGDDAA